MKALKYYEIRDYKKDEFCEKVVSFSSEKKPISYFHDNVWDFSKSACCREDRRSTYVLRFNYEKENIKISDYPELLMLYKTYVYIEMNKTSLQSVINTHFFNVRTFLNYLIEKKVFKFSEINNETLFSFEIYLLDSGNSISKIDRIRSTLKNLFSYQHLFPFENYKKINKNCFLNKKVYNYQDESKQTEIINDLEIKQIIKKCTNIIDNSKLIIIEKENKDKLYAKHKLNNPLLKGYERTKANSLFRSEWLRSGTKYKKLGDLTKDVRDVFDATCVIILAFTGMRISECLHMPIDCLKEVDSTCGKEEYKLYYIKSTTFKYETNKNGLNNTNDMRSEWLANHTVAKAIITLRKMYKEEHRLQKTDFLFCSVIGANFLQISQNVMRDRIKAFLNNSEILPHRFRRTFARMVARSAFGDVDILMEQFKHRTKEITEYYMRGDVDIEFLNYVEDDSEEIKDSVLWQKLLEKAQKDFGSELLNQLNKV